MTKKRNNDGTLIAPQIAMKERVKNLVVVRESDVSDKLLMLGMVDKTLYGCQGIPGVQFVKTFALEPFQNPEKFGAQLKTTPTHKMVLFAVEGTLFLYAMGSAAKEESDQSGNDFLEFLMEILKQYRPETMTLANITRLMRSTRRVGELQSLLIEIGCILRLEGGSLINVREPSGAMQFMMMSMFAAFERDHIVLRMLAGIVADSNRGGMHFREEHLPLGYKLVDGVVEPDLERVRDVAILLETLGLPITRRQMAETMSSAGVRLDRSFGPNKSNNPADARDMKGFVKGIEPWLDLYSTGIHKVKRENPFIGLDRIGVAPVIRTSESDPGYIELNYRWGLPEGGWVSDEVIARARQAFQSQSSKGSGGAGHKIRKPLLGIVSWVDKDSYQWVLDSHTGPEYRLRKRLFKSCGLKGWAEASIDGEIVTRMKSHDLHRSIADGITDAISSGVALETLQGHFIGHFSQSSFVELENTLSINALVNEEKFLRNKANRARNVVLSMAEEQDATPWINEAIEFERKADLHQKSIEALLETEKAVVMIKRNIPTDVAACASALSVLRRVEMSAPREVSDALGQILKDISIEVTPAGKVQWRLFVLLPTSEGAVRLGPITGEIDAVHRQILVTRSRLTPPIHRKAALEVFRMGGSVKDALEKVPDWSTNMLYQNIKKIMVKKGLPQQTFSTLLSATVPELRMAVFGGVLAKPNMTREDIPQVARDLKIDGCSLEWVEHVLEFYLFTTRSNFPGSWVSGVGSKQILMDHILESKGEMSLIKLGIALGGGYERPEISHKLLKPIAKSGPVEYLSIVEPGSTYKKVSGRITGESSVKLLKCPHCGGFASKLLVVPEVTRQLLCPSCRRMPTPDSPIFPETYLQVVLPLRRSKEVDWKLTDLSISAQKYLNDLSVEARAQYMVICEQCKTETYKRSKNTVLCISCKNVAEVKSRRHRVK